MIEPVDTFEHAGLTVRIRWEEHIDENDNPRTNHDGNIGVMFCEHSGYELGDRDAEDPREQTTQCPKCKGEGFVPWDGDEGHYRYEDGVMTCDECGGPGEIELSLMDYLRDVKKARVVLPLFLYDHSGITMSCGSNLLAGKDTMVSRNRFVGDGAGWDTSTIGVIYFDPELAEKWGCPEFTDEEIEKQLEEEVAYYAAYLEGSVFGYEIVHDGEVLDSCWGFLELNVHKDDASVREEARAAAEYCQERIECEKVEAHRWACADVVTVSP